MTLETYTIDGSTGGLDKVDNFNGFVRLGTVVLQIVVIVVSLRSRIRTILLDNIKIMLYSQLCVRVSSPGSSKRNGDEIGAKHRIEDAISVYCAVIDGLVHNIPMVALAQIVLHDIGDVSLDDSSKSSSGPRAARDPVG